MDRRDEILKYISKAQRGIEIGPYLWPLTPKDEGYDCLVMDVFDTDALKQLAIQSGYVSDQQRTKLQAVDLVGSSTRIDEVVAAQHSLGTFDYIVSSHNFEHLPNPIRFLNGCQRVLKPGGILSMAMPDRRACYDYFRSVTHLSEWIDAWLDDRHKPTLAQVFDNKWVRCTYDHHGVPHGSFFRGAPPHGITVSTGLDDDLSDWLAQRKLADEGGYQDAHCSVFTPASFELLLRDAGYLGLINFEIVEISESPGVDFFAHLRAVSNPAVLRPDDFNNLRNSLVHRVLDEASETSDIGHRVHLQKNGDSESELEAISSAIVRRIGSLDFPDGAKNLQEDITAIRNGVDAVQHKIESIATRLDKNEQRADEMVAANATIEELRRTVVALQNSTSWKITAPLRRLVSALRGATAPQH